MNNSHQQSSKENMKTSVLIQETHLTTKNNGSVQKISAKQEVEEDEQQEERKNRERERSLQNLFPISPLIGPYIKRKAKSKTIFLTLGEITNQSLYFPHPSILVPIPFNYFNLVLLSSNSFHQQFHSKITHLPLQGFRIFIAPIYTKFQLIRKST